MSFWNHTSIGGEQFAERAYRVGEQVNILPYPGEAIPGETVTTVTDGGQEALGLYPVTEADTLPPDGYYTRADPPYTLTLIGPEYQPGTVVEQRYQWVTMTNPEIADVKRGELDGHVSFISLQSARVTENGQPSNFWIVLDNARRAQFASRGNLAGWRVKDRTLGVDSNVEPPTVKPANTFWPENNDPTVLLIRDSNGNRLLAPSDEVTYGGILGDIETYDGEISLAEFACSGDIDAAEAADSRAQLVAIDVVADYAWPAYYGGPV